MNVTVGGGPAGSVLPICITEYCCPFPRDRKRMASRPEKSTRCMGCSPGMQITPAHGKGSPGAISPVTTSAPSRTTLARICPKRTVAPNRPRQVYGKRGCPIPRAPDVASPERVQNARGEE